MSGYYYSREAGAEGQILTGEGTAPGVGLDTLLDRERPPLRAALAIGSAIADVLCIAVEDRLIHGDIRPAHVKIDGRGTVSIEGYGVARRTTKAPEGKPDSHAVDVYGLGVVLHSILSPEPLGNLPKEPDPHDDEVVSRVLSMDFRQVQGKRWLEDVRKFLCQILAWAPADRPQPLDAANVLASVADQCPGETLEAWAQRATAAPAPRAVAAPPPRAVVEEEDLGGPVALSSPLAKGGVRKAPAAKGESTAFWSREKIAAMLAEDDDDAPPPPRRQTVAPPAPPRAEPTRPPEPRAEAARPPEPPRVETSRPVAARPPEPPPRAEPPPKPTPVAAGPAASPFAGAQIQASSVLDDEPPKKGMSPMMMVGIGMVLLVLGCGVLTLGGGGLYWFMGTGTNTAALEDAEKARAEAEAAAEKAKKDAEAAMAAAGGEAEGATEGAGAGAGGTAAGSAGGATASGTTASGTTASGTTSGGATADGGATKAPPSKATTSTGTASSGSSGGGAPKPPTQKSSSTGSSAAKSPPAKTAPAKATPVAASTPPAGGSYSVKFSTPGREAKLQCGDGQTAEFAGATTMTFQTTTTCLVRIDSGKGAVQLSKTASVSCTEDAGKVTCSGG